VICLKTLDELKDNEEVKQILRDLDEFMPDDLIRLILIEAGYENEPMTFNEKQLQKIMYDYRDSLPKCCKYLAFRTSGTYPYSDYIERIMMRLRMSSVFAPVDKMQLCKGTKKYHEKEFPDLDESTKQIAKEIGLELRKRMLGEE
jgi:hypothetical protein